MSTIREHLYLAALLHDIGKFYQRADTGSSARSLYLSQMVLELQHFILPSFKGQYSHKHCLWTAQFIEDFHSVFQQLSGNDLKNLANPDNLINLAAGHHLSESQQTALGKILKQADCLSSGMDRESTEALKDDQDESGWDAFKKKRMTSILQNICGNESKAIYHQPLSATALDKKFFARKTNYTEAPDYPSLWEAFLNDFKQIQANTYHAFAETLLSLMFKYTSTIPASTINFPDVSLYDHLKTTAAIAVCLYDYQHSEQKGETPFLLIGADFSGIQGYIYQIVSKHAAQNLKGRSFYIRLLSDAIVRYLLRELSLFQANVIYNSGGSFYLLAPNTGDVKQKLSEAVSFVEEQLFKTHSTSLFVALDYVPLSEDELMHRAGRSLRTAWAALFDKRNSKKQAKFATFVTSNYTTFFQPFQYCKGQRDAVTGELFTKGETPVLNAEIAESYGAGTVLKSITWKQTLLGRALRSSDVMVASESQLPYWNDKPNIHPAELGFHYYFLKNADLEQMKDQLRASADSVSIVTLNGPGLNCDFMSHIKGLNNIYSLEFYGGNTYLDKSFEQLCDGTQFNRLGILRMDVDNLGYIFQKGIPAERASLSRYATLSRSFDYFFSGYLNKIQQDNAFFNHSIIIYSGGDDVFIVGDWNTMIQMAERIQADFSDYTCHNQAFSISGGIAVINAKYPIMKGAAMSDEEEKRAKSHTITCSKTICEKNSISFLGTPLHWTKEYPLVKQLMNEIKVYLEQGFLPKSFVSKVLAHAANAQIVNHKIGWMKTYWMLTYDLDRMSKGLNENAKQLVLNCINEVCSNSKLLNGEIIETDYHPLELWAFASRWAELEYRTTK